jgi:hypothetical protein
MFGLVDCVECTVKGRERMDFLAWLQELARDANPMTPGFQPKPVYLVVCVLLPVTIGTLVGFGLRFIERVLGIETPRGGGH